jgi:hypothetical protein
MPDFIPAKPAATGGPASPADPSVVPLTDVERARMAELRAMPPPLSPENTIELDKLVEREAAPPPPDPKKVEAYLAETWAHLVGLVEQVVGTLPQLHGLAGRAAAMRAAFDAALFHAGPPPEAPPPSYEALPFGATRQEIEDRVKMLEALPRLSDEQTVELARLKSTL